MTDLDFRENTLHDDSVRNLVTRHLAGMYETSPAEGVFALGLDELERPDVTFWSGWRGDRVAVIGALKELGDGDAEIKSMRVADDHLGTGAGRAMLRHIVAVAEQRRVTRLWLETGGTWHFRPALRLYESEGFTESGPFADYEAGPFSVFMMRPLDPGRAVDAQPVTPVTPAAPRGP